LKITSATNGIAQAIKTVAYSSILAADAHRSICHSLSKPMGLHKYAAHINVEKGQAIENWLQGATN
jgi:hypothetical protein